MAPISYDQARPVATPEDLDSPAEPKITSGFVELPLHIRWSGQPKAYNLNDPRDRNRVYEQVLREGTDEDVRRSIDPTTPAELWTVLTLPRRVRQAWAVWFRVHRGLDLPC
jgi:hypothetical protein